MPASHDRLTPVISLDPVDGDTDLALLADYDRQTAQLALDDLVAAERAWRMTPSWRRLARRRHADRALAAVASIKRLGSVNVDKLAVDIIAERRARAAAADRRKENLGAAGDVMLNVGGVLGVLGVLAAGIWGVGSLLPTDQEQARMDGREARSVLEVVARSEAKYAARHEGKFTETLGKLEEVEDQTGSQDAESTLSYDGDIVSIVAGPGTWQAATTTGPRFQLLRTADGRYVATCNAKPDHGCVNGRWNPAGLPAR